MNSPTGRRCAQISLAIVLVMMAAPCWAEEFSSGPMRKLGRGMANIAFGIWELPITVKETNDTDGTVAATTLGVVSGLVSVLRRTMAGFYETITFPFPNPLVNYEPLIQPEFIRVSSSRN